MTRRNVNAIERTCLLAGLAIMGLRPLIVESLDSAGLSVTRALSGPSDPLPSSSLMIVGVILFLAVGMIVARVVGDERGYRLTGLEWGGAIVLLAAVVSCIAAGNKRLAINGAADWLGTLVLAILLVQLLNCAFRIRLAVCVLIASVGAQAAECLHQVYWVYPETLAMYAEERAAIWERQGVSIDSPQVALFEARLRAGEATGFLAHANVTGAHLVMGALVVAGLLFGRMGGGSIWRDGLGLALIGAISISAYLTGARGAWVAGMVALIVLVWRRRRGPTGDGGRSALRRGWVVAIAATFVVLGYAWMTNSLPGRTLDFRWKYWKASARMVAERALTGVGSGNFGRHYLQFKTIDSSEEVQHPHNFLVVAAADWGVAGAVGVMVMLIGASRVMVCAPTNGASQPRRTERPIRRSGETESERIVDDRRPACMDGTDDGARVATRRMMGWGLLVCGLIFMPRAFLLGHDDIHYVYFATMFPLLAWLGTFGAAMLVTSGVRVDRFATACGLAAMAFVLQDTINFASIVPGAFTSAAGVLAVAIASRYQIGARMAVALPGPPIRWLWGACAVFAVFAVGVLAPVRWSNEKMTAARAAHSVGEALSLYDEAARLDPLDSQPLYEAAKLARWKAAETSGSDRAMGKRLLMGAFVRLGRAIQRDPERLALVRESCFAFLLAAGVDLTKWEQGARPLGEQDGHGGADSPAGGNESIDMARIESAVVFARHAVKLYPTSPQEHELLGDCLAIWAGHTGGQKSESAWQEAVEHYRRALQIDDERPPHETIRRLSERQREILKMKMTRDPAELGGTSGGPR